MSGYVELHCHTGFSMLDGASMPEALLDRAAALGMPALAITDHDGLYGAVRFSMAAKERGIRPIIGAELTLSTERHLVLLAENPTGYRNLCWLISRAQLGQSKGNARLPVEFLRGRTEGLIALTGCRNGPVAAALLADRPGEARAALRELKALFGPRHLYVEIQHHLDPEDDALNAVLADLARDAGLPLVATNNVHYAARQGHELHDVLTCIRHIVPLREAGTLLRANSEYYLKSGAEMRALFGDYPEALANTLEIADRCQVEMLFRGQRLPAFPLPPGTSADAHLAELCEAGLPSRYRDEATAARKQLAHELGIIRQTELAEYFLVVWDIARFARERGIQVQGRGSAANSIVAYLLGITKVDPIAHNLLFERFLSAEVRVMPDIDIDFCAVRREEVIQYIYDTYGESHVGMVCNYVTYRGRSAVRDVGKALGLPPDLIDRLAKGVHGWGGTDIEASAGELLEAPDGVSGRVWEQYLSLCHQIQGFPRHLSIHVGGMCITRSPLDEVVPLERATMPGRVVIQWDKDNVEDAGLIKIDLLSLRTLSAVDECLHRIEEERGERVDLDAIPLDDPAVYDALQRADTIGTFQVESRAQQQALVQMKPACLADIVVEVALIRPGPLQGNMVHPFFKRRQGLEPVTYMHPILEPILVETLGVVVFQEQVIRIAMAMGGFSPGEADLLRRAMSRHRSGEEMAAFHDRFVDGAQAKGVDGAIAEDVFAKLAGFASYGFCKSHAAAFARTAYDTLYLRAHYPAEYYCGILNQQPMGFYAPRVVVGDARRHGVKVLPVHVNRSQEKCILEDGAIRLGLEYVDSLGEVGRARVLDARGATPYRDLRDFCRRTRLHRKVVEKLVLAGGLDGLGGNGDRRRLVWELGRLHYTAEELDLALPSDEPPLEEMTYAEELLEEYAATGLSAQGQMMEIVRGSLTEDVITSRELNVTPQGRYVRVAGMVVVRQRPPTAKGFAFLTLEDEEGLINVIARPQVYEKYRVVMRNSILLVVEGRVQQAHGQVNVLAERAWAVGAVRDAA